jgi:hypothetical protein
MKTYCENAEEAVGDFITLEKAILLQLRNVVAVGHIIHNWKIT